MAAASTPAPARGRGSRSARAAVAAVAAGAAALGATACAPVSAPGAGTSPPPITVTAHGAGPGKAGDIFLGPMGGGYPAGPEIISRTGRVLWFHALPAGELATDVRTQTYRGRPVLTWCQRGQTGLWTDVIYNGGYRQMATVRAGDGDATDYHEFLITPWNTALITATRQTTANLTAIGGSARQKVIDGVVQEVDIATGKVLFRWDSASHVPYRDSHRPLPRSALTPWDWFHINAVHLDTDGNLLISSRFTWAVYNVSLRSGKITWELGGKQSTFAMRAAPGQVLDSAGEIFAYQHDPVALGSGLYTIYDDESDGGKPLLPYSRAVTVRLDLAARVATLIRSVNQPRHLVSAAQGSFQTTSDGRMLVDWGSLPYISEFSPSGRPLLTIRLPGGVVTYRAYLLPWHPPGR